MSLLIIIVFLITPAIRAANQSDPNDKSAATKSADSKSSEIASDYAAAFEQARFRPIPSEIAGLREFQKSLDGVWKFQFGSGAKLNQSSLNDSKWKDFQVPGQWLQQGFKVSSKQTVTLAREFTIPKEWADYRIFVRFNAVHAGTSYQLNGHALGYSECLFTPVEWEITSQAKIGEVNRVDLVMNTDTLSEKIASASRYAQHSLGGIPRSVSIYARPKIHTRNLRIETDLDKNYDDAELKVNLIIDNASPQKGDGLTVDITLIDPSGKLVEHSNSNPALIPSFDRSEKPVAISTHVKKPLKWNAEKPHLYKLKVDLKQNGKSLEIIEKNVGFRKVERRGSEILVNGVVVKLAGVCRHEVNAQAGRADTMQFAEADVRQFKVANMNYIRTTHYPPTMELVEAADKYGMYLEVEAPLTFVFDHKKLPSDPLQQVLYSTSAMIDYYYSNPSVVIWSVANESDFTPFFETSAKMIKRWDSTRLTTFNFPDKGLCDIANLHYPPTPYDKQTPDDPRPIILGEFYFPVCHEQTDVRINPGLREFYGFGHSEPDSAWGKECAKSYAEPIPFLKPGLPPGTWSDVMHSKRISGGAVFAAIDDSFYFRDGTHAGFSWKHGFWGMVDAWRRPKPEYWMAQMVFSPVWFNSRHAAYSEGQKSVSLSVENRYSFTDFSELSWSWEIGENSGPLKVQLAPRQTGKVEIEIPGGTPVGSQLIVRVKDASGRMITAPFITLGKKEPAPLPQLASATPSIKQENNLAIMDGNGFTLVFDKTAGNFNTADKRHTSPITRFPSLHVTRFDFGDLDGGKPKEPYAVFPDWKSRVVDEATVTRKENGIEITVREHFDMFAGTTTWLIDKNGLGKVRYDYVYSGNEMSTREQGVRFELKSTCDEIEWHRWSEWGNFPDDSISRTIGRAKALRTGKRETDPEHIKPTWPWSQDQTELGTADFRSIKFNVYKASLIAKNQTGLRLHANADAHLRCNLADSGVQFHALLQCRLGQILIKKNDRLTGEFTIEILK